MELKELQRQKEIVEWQIQIAKDYKILQLRQQRLQQLNKQIEKLTQNQTK